VLAPDGDSELARQAFRSAFENMLDASGAVVELDGKRFVQRATVRQVLAGMVEALRQAALLDGEIADGPSGPRLEAALRRIEAQVDEAMPERH
jgi:hypothetical protein